MIDASDPVESRTDDATIEDAAARTERRLCVRMFIEVDTHGSPNPEDIEEARQGIEEFAVPSAREAGASAGYWLAPSGDGLGRAVMVFDDEPTARAMVEQMPKVGDDTSVGTTFQTITVCEVMTSL